MKSEWLFMQFFIFLLQKVSSTKDFIALVVFFAPKSIIYNGFGFQLFVFLIIVVAGCSNDPISEQSSEYSDQIFTEFELEVYQPNTQLVPDLPLSPELENINWDTVPLPKLILKRDSLFFELLSMKKSFFPPDTLLSEEIENTESEMEYVKLLIHLKKIESLCGEEDESQDVELYDGHLEIPKSFVIQVMDPVGQIQWKSDFGPIFDNPGNSRGNLEGKKWCSGCLVTNDLFLTAGHCFEKRNNTWRFPKLNGKPLDVDQIARLMEVNFNYQIDSNTQQLRPFLNFPIIDLVEYRENRIDFALVRLGPNSDGELPGQIYGTGQLSQLNAAPFDTICIIQHPKGKPKKIEVGPISIITRNFIQYNDIDTHSGSSGSPIFHYDSGLLIGIHTNGGCNESGHNLGYNVESILNASTVLKSILGI